MRTGRIITAMLVPVLLCGPLTAQAVDWVKGTTGPAAWAINPASPSTSSVIAFSGPLDVASYGNSCAAEASLGGTPQLTIDTFNRVVQLWFQGPAPTQCILIYSPVSGLEGTFGPLSAGKWTFRCPTLSAEIEFIVGAATVTYVDRSAIGPPSGMSWYRAYRNVQDALVGAGPGDEIWVADGTYTPDNGGGQTPGDRTASFDIPDGVTLRGGYAGYGAPAPDARDFAGHPTVLSGDLNGDDLWGILNKDDNSYHVVTTSGAPILDGLTIAHGQANGAHPHHYGGGLYIPSGMPTLTHCRISGNTGVYGGGIAALGAGPLLANCDVSGNRAWLFGGGLYSHDSNTTLNNCLMTGNSAGTEGAGGGSAICNIGGIAAQIALNDSTLSDNVGPWPVDWVIFSFNYFETMVPATTTVRISNSIVYNDGGASLIWSSDPATVVASHSLVQGGWAGSGNLDTSPVFVNRGIWSIEGEWIYSLSDYGLQAASPAIDAGSNSLIPTDLADVDRDGNAGETHPIDLAGLARVQDGQVDMGVYEQTGAGPGPGPGPGPAWVELRTFEITFDVPTGLTSPTTLNGNYSHEVEANFEAELKLEVQATSVAGGTWTAWFDPDPGNVGPGSAMVSWRVRGENVGVHLLTPGASDVTIAEVTIYVRPAP